MGRLPAYSVQFIVRNEADPLVPFEVPESQVAVIRDFSSYQKAGSNIYYLFIQNSVLADTVCVAALTGTGVANYAQWQGRVVVPGGGQISVSGDALGGSADIYVGGYLLAATL